LKLRSLGGAKAKADVIASHATNIAHRVVVGNRPSGGEHYLFKDPPLQNFATPKTTLC
jgi:hypothetical protein